MRVVDALINDQDELTQRVKELKTLTVPMPAAAPGRWSRVYGSIEANTSSYQSEALRISEELRQRAMKRQMNTNEKKYVESL